MLFYFLTSLICYRKEQHLARQDFPCRVHFLPTGMSRKASCLCRCSGLSGCEKLRASLRQHLWYLQHWQADSLPLSFLGGLGSTWQVAMTAAYLMSSLIFGLCPGEQSSVSSTMLLCCEFRVCGWSTHLWFVTCLSTKLLQREMLCLSPRIWTTSLVPTLFVFCIFSLSAPYHWPKHRPKLSSCVIPCILPLYILLHSS